jgi:hypothetical protein
VLPKIVVSAFRWSCAVKRPVQLLLYWSCACSCASANIGVIQIYRTAPWLGIVSLVVAILIEGATLGKILEWRSADRSIRDRSLLVMLAGNLVCFLLGFAFPNLTSADLTSYLGTHGALGTHLVGFVILWIGVSTLVKAPIALLMLNGRYASPIWIMAGVMAATVASSLVLAAGTVALGLWY